MTAPKPPNTWSREGRHKLLLEDQTVKDWYDEMTLRSRLTADSYLRGFGRLLESMKLDPSSLVALAKSDPTKLSRLLVAHAKAQQASGRFDSSTTKPFIAMRSYLTKTGVEFRGYPKLRPISGESLAEERVPTPEELDRLLLHLSPRGKVVALLMAHAGLRPGAIGGYGGGSGLTFGDLEFDLTTLRPKEVPFLITIRSALSKNRRAYHSFGGAQLGSVITAYAEERRAKGEKLTAGSPVVAVEEVRGIALKLRQQAEFGAGFLTTTTVTREIREAFKLAVPGESFRPYCCRAYFSTRLLLSPMSRDLRESLMGHQSISSTYNLSKKWGPELLSEARRSYADAARFLETGQATKTDTKGEILRSLLAAVESATGKKSGGNLSGDDLVRAIRDALGAAGPAPVVADVPTRPAQRVVAAAEVQSFLEKGWTFLSALGSQAVISAPPA